MNAIVIANVKVGDLPEEWRAKLAANDEARVTVRIEETPEAGVSEGSAAELPEEPLLGMWRDRAEMDDVQAYVRSLRAPRFTPPE